jgi:hypothetical protein
VTFTFGLTVFMYLPWAALLIRNTVLEPSTLTFPVAAVFGELEPGAGLALWAPGAAADPADEGTDSPHPESAAENKSRQPSDPKTEGNRMESSSFVGID